MRLPAFISKLCLFALSVSAVSADTLLQTLDREVTALYEKSKPAIVKIHAERVPTLGGFALRPVHRVGTGFFIDGEGRLLTAATILDDAEKCWIEWRGQRVPAAVVGRDAATNLALLKVATGSNAPCLKLGDSDEVSIGSLVVAVGFPYELPCAPVVGFVSGLDIQKGSGCFITSHFRAGCKLSPGQGGAPMFNARGEVIGIAVAARPDDQCYALPINAARKVCADILQYGQAQHGWVGLSVTERHMDGTNTPPAAVRILIKQVFSNSPAAEIGFRDNDELLKIGTNQVQHAADLVNALFRCRHGDHLNFAILRNGLEQHLSLVVAPRPTEETLATQTPPHLPVAPPGQIGTLPVVPASAAGSR